MKERITTKAMHRRNRRSRLRYRKSRFNNRTKSKLKGWLAPSLQHKLESQLKIIDEIHKLLPITKTVVEVANFDSQKMQNDIIQGVDYQQGNRMGFGNTREYVLHRDNHKCHSSPNHKKSKFLYNWCHDGKKVKNFKGATFMSIIR